MAIRYEPPICPKCGQRHSLYRCAPGTPATREAEPEAIPAPSPSKAPPAAIEPPPAPKKPPFDRAAYQRAYMAVMRAYRARRRAEKEAVQQHKDGQ